MAAKKRRGGSSRRGAGPLLWGLFGSLVVALTVLQLLPSRRELEPSRGELPAPSERAASSARPEAAAPERASARPGPAASREGRAGSPVVPVAASLPARDTRRPGVPKVAIVIDDCGYDLALLRRFLRLDVPMTFAVIPRLAHSEEAALEAWSKGKEVILHQPMEPDGYASGIEPGEGALLRGMSRSQVAGIVRENLGSIPHVSGLNNHMGSAATADPELMAFFLGEVALHPGLYFLDSKTSPATVAYDTARRKGLPTAMRSVFLDHDESLPAVRAQLEDLLAQAEEEGEAIGIGHVKGATLTAVEAMLATVGRDEFDFVFASELAR